MKKVSCLVFLVFLCSFLFSEEYSLYQKNGLKGIINNNREVVKEASYDWISIDSKDIVCCKSRNIEIYNLSLELLYQSGDKWVNLTNYNEDEIIITDSQSGKKVLLNLLTGKMTEYSSDYGQEYGFKENLALVIEKNKQKALYSVVDTKGNVILTDIEQAHSCYTNGMMAVILENGKSGFVNKKGKLVIETDFYIDPEDLGPRKYPSIDYAFSENYALVKNNDKKWVQYNLKGKKQALPENILPIDPYYKNGLMSVKNMETNKFGYMNNRLGIAIPFIFDDAKRFTGKYAIVIYEGKDAIVDKEGNIFFCDEM